MMVENMVKKVISHYCGGDVSKVEVDCFLFDDLAFDSLDHIECIMKLEEELKVAFLDSDIDEIKTVQDVIDFVYRRKEVHDE